MTFLKSWKLDDFFLYDLLYAREKKNLLIDQQSNYIRDLTIS